MSNQETSWVGSEASFQVDKRQLSQLQSDPSSAFLLSGLQRSGTRAESRRRELPQLSAGAAEEASAGQTRSRDASQ